MVTIKEMAQELGVSTTTVSNVIHGKTKEVSLANIERIQKILKKYLSLTADIQHENDAHSQKQTRISWDIVCRRPDSAQRGISHGNLGCRTGST